MTARPAWALATFLTACLVCGAGAPAERDSARPVPRTDANSLRAHAQLVEKAKKGRIDLYFVGDSITRRWGTSDRQYRDFLANWKHNFHGWNAGNFGWGGDTVQNILWRLDNGELDGVHPRALVLMAGTNNLGNVPPAPPRGADAKVDEVTRGIEEILKLMRRKAPGATIVLTAITPRNDSRPPTAMLPTIDRVNAALSHLADGKKVRYLNINDKLADPDGKLLEGMTVDGLHLSTKGYQVWAHALEPILTEILGPRAAADHAPEPTGDPSAAGR